jgi:hypothetical protein
MGIIVSRNPLFVLFQKMKYFMSLSIGFVSHEKMTWYYEKTYSMLGNHICITFKISVIFFVYFF